MRVVVRSWRISNIPWRHDHEETGYRNLLDSPAGLACARTGAGARTGGRGPLNPNYEINKAHLPADMQCLDNRIALIRHILAMDYAATQRLKLLRSSDVMQHLACERLEADSSRLTPQRL